MKSPRPRPERFNKMASALTKYLHLLRLSAHSAPTPTFSVGHPILTMNYNRPNNVCTFISFNSHKAKLLKLKPLEGRTSLSAQLRWARSFHGTKEGTNPTKILFDGDCKICQVEISLLKKYTRDRGDLLYVDISSLDYDPSLNGGVSYEDAMKEMHVIGQDGKVYIQGDAIRQMYRACGLGWLASLTEVPVMKPICDQLYIIFAKYRLRKALERCDSDSCSVKLKRLRDDIEKSNK